MFLEACFLKELSGSGFFCMQFVWFGFVTEEKEGFMLVVSCCLGKTVSVFTQGKVTHTWKVGEGSLHTSLGRKEDEVGRSGELFLHAARTLPLPFPFLPSFLPRFASSVSEAHQREAQRLRESGRKEETQPTRSDCVDEVRDHHFLCFAILFPFVLFYRM